MAMTPLQALFAHDRETQALAQVAGRLGWDQETVMPEGAAAQRAEEIGALQDVLHRRHTDPRLGEWLAAVDEGALSEIERARLREIRRSFDRATRLPDRLAAAIAKETSLGHRIWAQAREKEDFAAFAPALKRIVALKREEAAALADGKQDGASLYDALLDDYEPNASAAGIAELFNALRPRLVALAERIKGSGRTPPTLSGEFDESAQMRLSTEMALTFGYDLTRGRIDKAVHPFSSGSGSDVRITTRTARHDPFNCIYSTIHEVGHACYEQTVDADLALTAIGHGASMGVHESQSRSYENQLGRSRAFTGYLLGRMRHHFGDFGVADADAFHAIVNRVAPGHIRTEADEVHYNLHVMLRFDLERALIAAELEVDDLPDAWNARFLADFGIAVDKPSNGVLQDVHWSAGLFGYFPTYTLGNVYAGCLVQAMRRDVPELDAQLAQGKTGAATGWMREKVQRFGALRSPADTIAHATGAAPSAEPLLDYLEAKFSDLYRL